jgi:hypothetical protein
VPEFRAYIVDANGRYVGVHQIVALTRDDAVEAAIRLVDGHALELWTGDELIGTLTSSHSGSGPTFKRPTRR